MTFENAKRLYDHYLSMGMQVQANELANKRPALKEEKKEVKKKVKDEEVV
jgi:hypothetical protein